MRKTQIAWAAGLFDGEGCIYIQYALPTDKNALVSISHDLRVQIGMVHKPSIIKFRKTIGSIGSIFKKKRCIGSKGQVNRAQWVIRTVSNDAEKVLKLLLPYLITKRKEAEIALKFCSTTRRRRCLFRTQVPYRLILKREDFRLLLQKQKTLEWDD